MSLDAVRAAIVARLAAVPGVGPVHEYQRFAANEAAFRRLYVHRDPATGGERMQGWDVHRQAVLERRDDFVHEEVTTWRLRGFMAIDDADASEHLFDALVEAVRAAFRVDHNLGGAVASTDHQEFTGLQLDDSGPVMFAGVLCHGATLTLYTRAFL